MKLLPKTKAPSLELNLLSRQPWSLETSPGAEFNLLVVYRGYHCPICKSYLRKFHELLERFNELGVSITAVSCDNRERAEKARDEWGLGSLSIGYNLSKKQMEAWGLYGSESIKDSEPDFFAEPGLFLIRQDGTLYYAAYNSMPFGRPEPQAILEAVKFVLDNDYPARGEVHLAAALA